MAATFTMSHTASGQQFGLWRPVGVSIVLFFLLLTFGCAATPSPDPAGPSTGEPTYPILLLDNEGERREAAQAAWTSFARSMGIVDPPAPEFQPVTSTLRSLPASLPTALYLPRFGESPPMSEDELREALRRFISDAGSLLCGEPQQLSLIQRVDGADGVKQAFYKQRPFRYGLRGGYGELRISFMSDGRIVALSSSCVPDTDRIRRSFVGLNQQRLPIDKLIGDLSGQAVSFIDKNGQQQTYTIGEKENLSSRELVIYPVQRMGEPPAIEIHSAWEIIVESNPGLTIYVDSVSGKILGAEFIQQP